ncbi:MAG: serine/threonine protein kinase, partial [Cyanobacteria bacterium]|nr:serine/threonine protein kinase [Cyanobacteriota bacterium]
MDLTSGSKVFDKFEVIDQIGAGGMGAIYKANHVLLNRVVVLKVLSISTTVKKSLLRFQNEAKTLSKLNHPGIAKVYDFGLSDNVPYIALEFIEGKTLMEVLNEKGSLAADEALPLILQLCDALSHAHACEIVHRDLKPSNIVLRQSGEETQVVLLDFGIAKLLADSDSSLTHAGDIIGSPPYMSPEQCTGKPTSYGTDQYSLGCVIFEMLTGEPPFVGETALHTMLLHQQEQPPLLSSRCPSPVPQQLEELVAKLLAKNEGDRFESIKGVASAIMVLIPTLSRTPEGEYSRADRSAVSGLARIRSVRSRNFVYAALLVCSLGALVFFVLLNRGSKPMDGSAKADSGNEQYLMKLARVGEKAKVVNDPEYQIAFVDHRYLYAEEEETDLSNWNHLQRVDLSDSAVTDKDLSVLRGKKIINLTLKGCEIHSVENILQLPYLTYLDLGKTPIGDKELKQLASLKMLQTLLIQKTNVTPEGLQALKRFALLHTVFLSGPGKTIDELRKAMPGCKFRPYYEQSITDEMVTTEVLPQARQQCRNCIKVIEKAQGKNAPRAIAYLSSLVVRSLQMSKFKEAMRENDEALTVSQTMNNTVLLQQALGNKASIFYFMHLKETKPKKSMAYMKQAARFARESLSLKKDL